MQPAAAMTNRISKTAAGSLALAFCLSSLRLLFSFSAQAYDDSIPAYAGEIMQTVSGGDVQAWLDNALPAQVGLSSPDWYTIALAGRGGYDFSAYSAALQSHIELTEIPSGTTRERMALALCACEPAAPAVCGELLDSSAGTLGIMSWIFALHLLNNGVPSAQYTVHGIAEILLEQQAPDGGWSLAGDRGDPDVTAMTVQALAPYRDTEAVGAAIGHALDYLADTQLSSGAYMSFGTENPESAAQVWAALSALGIDALADERFIKDGHTLLDGILQFRIGEGQYAHTLGGDANNMATVQVYLALTAAELQQSGGNLYLLHGASPQWDAPAETVTEPPAHPATDAAAETHTAAGTSSESTQTRPSDTTAVRTTAATSKTDKSASISTTTTAVLTAAAAEIVHTTAPPADPRSDTEKYPYRIPLTAAAAAIFGVSALIFAVRKNRSAKTYLTLAGGFCIVIALVWCIKIESPDRYYQSEMKTGGGNVTMSIRCDSILGMAGSERFPADGCIMPLTEFSIAEGENALDLLYDAVKAYTLQIEVDGVSGDVVETAYVRGIASLYEFDFGDLSGWTYEVNGERPPVGCGAYTLHDGDRVDWVYTVQL